MRYLAMLFLFVSGAASASVQAIPALVPSEVLTGNNTVTCNKWTITSVGAVAQQGVVSLRVVYDLGYLSEQGAFVSCKFTPVVQTVQNIMTDAAMGPAAGTFFGALASKAFGAGLLH